MWIFAYQHCGFGPGLSCEGDFHEALNLASVWRLPVIFIIENNGYGLSTPTNEQTKPPLIAEQLLREQTEKHKQLSGLRKQQEGS
jgi:2-oxoisovalerate dehydrogenase E1 component